MPNRARPSRFTGARTTVEPPSVSDTITRAERYARELAWQAERPMLSDEEWHSMRHRFDVHDDQEVLNDAERAVVMETPEWRATWVLARREGAFVVRSLHLEPVERLTPASGITSNLLRELSPSAAVAAAANVVPQDDGWAGSLLQFAEQFRQEHGPPEEKAPPRRRGRPKVDDGELVWLSVLYLGELDQGPGVIRRVTEAWANGQVSESTVRDRIRMARERGFLTATKRGRRGGEPGPALYEALRHARSPEQPFPGIDESYYERNPKP